VINLEKNDGKKKVLGFNCGLALVLVVILVGIPLLVKEIIQQTADQAMAPVQQDSDLLKTRSPAAASYTDDPSRPGYNRPRSSFFSTPGDDPIFGGEGHHCRRGQGQLSALFGDKLLFVAHGEVIAGIDLAKMNPQDIWVANQILYVRLPQPEYSRLPWMTINRTSMTGKQVC